VLPIGSVLVDFDGTACLHDVAEHLLIEFGDPSWREFDDAELRGEVGARECLIAQAAMLEEPFDRLLAFAVAHCPIDPTFPPFARWLAEHDIPVTLVSDGFGFYIPPILHAAGLDHLRVMTNSWSADGDRRIDFANGHPECIGCGTCKMNAVLSARARGPVVFVGEGQSDRYGALYSDVVFAKDRLVEIAARDGVRFEPWDTFDDVRTRLEALEVIPGPVGGERCPGWRTP
jgi:2,3-diketo-5-methylthio-1-phosphopentane phosphatase